MVSASKDATVKFWDVVSGACIHTLSRHVGEVTSVDAHPDGTTLLTASKDDTHRLWDLRAGKLLHRLGGHQNMASNYVRACFGAQGKIVASGSEDGHVYMWDAVTGKLLDRLSGHRGVVGPVAWSQSESLLASGSHDGDVRTWAFNPKRAEEDVSAQS